MQILVVSGFLGAGKTTFIQELARRSGKDFAIFENEYGQADIDAARLAQFDSGLSVWESTENCICCSGKQDFATSVLTISNAIDPEYLVVEPTGVAKLSSIIENINQVSYEKISLLAPITIVDGAAWTHERTQAIWQDQVRSAHTIVISKLERLAPGELDDLVAYLRTLNSEAEIIAQNFEEISTDVLSHLLDLQLDPESMQVHDAREDLQAEDEFETLSIEGVALTSEFELLYFLDALTSGLFGHIARAKGHVACGSQMLRFDVVDVSWAVTGSDIEEGSTAVFIGQNLKRGWLREYMLPEMRELAKTRLNHDEHEEHQEEDHSHCDHEHGICTHEHHHTDEPPVREHRSHA